MARKTTTPKPDPKSTAKTPPQNEGETKTPRAQAAGASTAIAHEKVAITAARDPYRRAGLALGKNPLVIAVDDLDGDQREALDADPNVFIRAHEDDSPQAAKR